MFKSMVSYPVLIKRWIELTNNRGLVKSCKDSTQRLFEDLPQCPTKMAVLKILSEEINSFLQTGKTDEAQFEERLASKGLINPSVTLSCNRPKIPDILLPQQGKFQIKNTAFEFYADSLIGFRRKEWLSNTTILTCLHLSDKLKCVRIGCSTALHYESGPNAGEVMADPFQVMGQTIKAWRRDMVMEPICFFPLFLHNNHFSLLEINYQTDTIYHYDSMAAGVNNEVKVSPSFNILLF